MEMFPDAVVTGVHKSDDSNPCRHHRRERPRCGWRCKRDKLLLKSTRHGLTRRVFDRALAKLRGASRRLCSQRSALYLNPVAVLRLLVDRRVAYERELTLESDRRQDPSDQGGRQNDQWFTGKACRVFPV
jgi:hypothetical protein